MIAILQTRDGGYVGTHNLPPFNPPAEAVVWGSRIFLATNERQIDRDGLVTVVYREGLAWFIPDWLEMADHADANEVEKETPD